MAIVVEDSVEPIPETEPLLERDRRFRLPWTRTRVSVGIPNGELIVRNETARIWVLHLGFHGLGSIAPGETVRLRESHGLRLTARPLYAPIGTPYLVVDLDPHATGVRIFDASGGEEFFDLELLYPEIGELGRPLRSLGLRKRTLLALHRAGLRTVEEVAAMTEQELLSVHNLGRRGYEELMERLRGLQDGDEE
jgi:hypothetical protein